MTLRILGLTVLAGATACYSPTAPFGVPCSASSECPTGQQCDALTNTCLLPTEPRTWRDDTAADFMTSSAALEDAAIEQAGFVGPAAYVTGRVRLAGIASHLIADPASTPWDSLAAAPITGIGFAHSLVLDFGTGIPPGLGLETSDDVTVLVEGEIYLDAPGVWQIELDANDRGFLELAAPGTAVFTRVVSDVDNRTTAPYTVSAPGWHRLRGAVADAAMAIAFVVRVDPPNLPGNAKAVLAEQLRARVDDLTGFVVDGFADQALLNYSSSSLAAASLADVTIALDPYGLPVGEDFSLRWSGQVLIDVDGDYAFRLDSRGGHRAWLDGVEVADKFTSAAELTITPPQHLDPGWHDLVVDLQRQGGPPGGRLAVTVESGPTWVGQGIPGDHVRPVVGRAVRWVEAHSHPIVGVPDMGSARGTVSLELPPNMLPLRIDTSFLVEHPVLTSLSVALDPPVGDNITLAAAGSMTGAGFHAKRSEVSPSNAGSTWGFIVTDGVIDAMTGSLRGMFVTLVCSGGIAPVPLAYRFESKPRELGEVVGWGVLDWGLRQASTGSATIQMRSCDDATGCATEPWVTATKGEVPPIPVRRFAQYQIELTSNGDIPTALDWIDLAYSARIER